MVKKYPPPKKKKKKLDSIDYPFSKCAKQNKKNLSCRNCQKMEGKINTKNSSLQYFLSKPKLKTKYQIKWFWWMINVFFIEIFMYPKKFLDLDFLLEKVRYMFDKILRFCIFLNGQNDRVLCFMLQNQIKALSSSWWFCFGWFKQDINDYLIKS